MGTPENSREPCPDRILDDIGGAFAMGAVGGSAVHFFKGFINSPKAHRLSGASQAARMNAPRIGGSFAVWGALFSSFDCSFVYLRQKEDPWNSILAGAATGGFLQLRHGAKSSARSAMFGGVLLAMIEGAGILLTKVMSPPTSMPMPMEGQMPPGMAPGMNFPQPPYGGHPEALNYQSPPTSNPSASSSGSSWFEGLFRGRKDDAKIGGEEKGDNVLESFDKPSTPIPSFEYK
ncbi:hypothetical protein AMTRI_Chr01g134260 [Amborella trichopoda]|uniref:Uncharacterized protein n=1 Tax=Amborella trichopoda TaxID=13333 RepID=W1Q140_AMBTC|nr:mitochondrial import inner membrane translocase subunit TIM17-2 [Amborella trichopoda]ERN14160.1 hypothetical protein AMTR_s00021p00254700 [Amborella trichopoda]|eukprot:XP_006852693.1 mitochondrial import inner membrane translocase subunit TIM17-2 [Amborella trichopoda]